MNHSTKEIKEIFISNQKLKTEVGLILLKRYCSLENVSSKFNYFIYFDKTLSQFPIIEMLYINTNFLKNFTAFNASPLFPDELQNKTSFFLNFGKICNFWLKYVLKPVFLKINRKFSLQN